MRGPRILGAVVQVVDVQVRLVGRSVAVGRPAHHVSSERRRGELDEHDRDAEGERLPRAQRQLDGDVRKDFGGVSVVTDRMSAPYLMGASIDFVDTIEKQGFTIDNPNATGSCACGDSFS